MDKRPINNPTENVVGNKKITDFYIDFMYKILRMQWMLDVLHQIKKDDLYLL